MSQSDEAIMAHSERITRSRPKFQAHDVWQRELAALMTGSRSA